MTIDLETVARIRACHTPMSGGHHCIQCFGDFRLSDEDCAWPCATVRLCDAWEELRATIHSLIDSEDGACRLGHEGYCQEHRLSRPCVVAAARNVLEDQ